MSRYGRRFDYDRRLLPHPLLAELDAPASDPEMERLKQVVPATDEEREALAREYREARNRWSGPATWTMGYPSWNLLYFSVLCSLPRFLRDAVVIETGTNRGLSTIAMAQALADLEIDDAMYTVELEADLVAIAEQNVAAAGLTERVRFHTGDSLSFLSDLAAAHDHFDFVFLDDAHDREHVQRQIDIVCPKVAAGRGKVYFDNSGRGGVAEALDYLRERHGGNLVTFLNCSSAPPGNTIWQPG
jgi:predicted O-methyltransferase YrrM